MGQNSKALDYSLLITLLSLEFICAWVSDRFCLFERKIKLTSAPSCLLRQRAGRACLSCKLSGSANELPSRKRVSISEAKSNGVVNYREPTDHFSKQGVRGTFPNSFSPGRKGICHTSKQGAEARSSNVQNHLQNTLIHRSCWE